MIRDYWRYDGLALAELVRKAEVTAHELVESALEASAQLIPLLNAICHDLADRARAAASKVSPQSPFAAVPFLLKDIGAQMKGTPYECGSRLMQGYVSTHDTHLTERFERAGLITIGKTTTPEFGAQVTTEPALTGATRNPWNLAAMAQPWHARCPHSTFTMPRRRISALPPKTIGAEHDWLHLHAAEAWPVAGGRPEAHRGFPREGSGFCSGTDDRVLHDGFARAAIGRS